MTPDQAIAEARAGKLRPLYLVAGEESYLSIQVVNELKKAALAGAVPGLNDDHFDASNQDVGKVLAAARTLPMMAKRRLVVVQHVEEWEPKSSAADDGARGKPASADSFERLLEYAKQPSPTTTLLLVGRGLDKRRKLMVNALKEGWLVSCDPLARAELPAFVTKVATRLGGRLEEGVADLIAELAGPELSPLADAVDRLCLYAGEQSISDAMVLENVVRLRITTVWELLQAVGRRDAGAALAALDAVYDPNETIRLVGLLAWSARQLLRFEAGLQRGLSPAEAAQQAGAPPFKARELSQQIKNIPRGTFVSWLVTLTDVDRDLKGGSKLPAKAVLERGILELCRAGSAERPGGA